MDKIFVDKVIESLKKIILKIEKNKKNQFENSSFNVSPNQRKEIFTTVDGLLEKVIIVLEKRQKK